MIIVLLIVVAALNLLLSLMVLSANPEKQENLFFALLAFFVGIWAAGIAFFLLSDQLDVSIFWAKIYYISAASIALFMSLFSSVFFGNQLSFKQIIFATLPWMIVVFPIGLIENYLTRDLIVTRGTKEIILGSAEYALYTIFFIPYFSYSILSIFRKYQARKGLIKAQLKYVLFAIFFAGTVGVIFNLALPWLGNYRLIWVGPLFTSFFVSVVSYSMYKHQLFDFRLFIARSIGYVSMLLVIMAAYLFVSIILANSFLSLNLSSVQLVYLSLMTFIISSSYSTIKALFDRLSNKVFYRDNYDSESLINKLGDQLVVANDVRAIFITTDHVLRQYISPRFFSLVLKDKQEVFTNDSVYKSLINQRVISTLDNRPSPVYINSQISESELAGTLNPNIAVSISLRSGERRIGYLVLGPRRSGGKYTRADRKIFAIIANELSVAVENAQRFSEIKDFNIGLEERIGNATRDLKKSNQKLKALDEAKDEFISMASHQLRTPLTSVKGYLSMVMEGDVGKLNPQQEKMLNEAFTSSQRMVYLIADLLNVSRLKTGKFIIEKSEFSLPDVVESELAQLGETAKARGIKMTFTKPKRFPAVMLDETKTRQVIMNFADNAVYYTPKGGKIEIQLKATKDEIQYLVKDNGIGVKDEEQRHLFTKFFRGGNAKKARPDGTGLGLYMAKKVVSAQGGRVIFESKENKGSTFGFAFPRNKSTI